MLFVMLVVSTHGVVTIFALQAVTIKEIVFTTFLKISLLSIALRLFAISYLNRGPLAE